MAWETVIGSSDFVLRLAEWKDDDWERVFRRRLDHWLRPKFGRRPEREMLSEVLQRELGLDWESPIQNGEESR